MTKTSTKKPAGAKKLLQNVKPEWKAFWFSHGVVAHNLSELENALKKISKENFAYHVNKEKNDLSMWAKNVVGDHDLANRLKRIKTLKSAQKAVAERVTDLQNMVSAKKISSRAHPKAKRVLRRRRK